MIAEVLSALILVLFAFFAGRVLGGSGDFTTTLRSIGFAYATRFYSLLAFLPVIGDAAKFITLAFSIVAVWIAGVQAHKLRGWRSIVFPIVVIGVFLLSVLVLQILLEGAEFTIQNIFGG